MEPGTRVEVRSRFDRSWARGFEVVEVVPRTPDGSNGDVTDDDGPPLSYRVRRRTDGKILPVLFPESDVREEKRGRGMWWY